MPATLTITDTVDFLHSQATEQDLDTVLQAIRLRRKALGNITASAVQVDLDVRLDGLSPKYLNGLTGKVTDLKGDRATVRLDENSTDTLRVRSRGKRFYIPELTAEYDLGGIPMSCCHTV